MDMIPSNSSFRRYERDFLLQLRLHPFSLQKPKSLKDHEIVKDKLYLHQMENCSGSSSSNLSNARPACHSTMKPDSDIMFRSHRILPECYPRSCPLYSTSYKCNSGYHGMPSSKYRPFYLSDSMNPARKCPVPTSPDYKFDLLDEIFSPSWPASQAAVPWSKQSSYEDLWNSYNRSLQNNTPKDQCEAPVKSKKTLPIIDPANGKNILEGILNSPRTSQESIEENESEPKDKGLSSGVDEFSHDKPEGSVEFGIPNNGYEVQSAESSQELCAPQVPEGLKTTQDLHMLSVERGLKELCTLKEAQSGDTIAHGNNLNICKEETLDKSIASFPSKQQMGDYEKTFSYNSSEDLASVTTKNTDNLKDKENYYNQSLHYNERFCSRDSALRTEEQLKANIAMLKEKLYVMRQEQQKMVIYQSFLRYKKHQLDELVRHLDDQKIEIANWECNLVNKEKRLKDRESWLEAKRKDLKNKEDDLRERERKLAKGSSEIDDGKWAKYPNEIGDGKLAKDLNEFDAWKLSNGHNEFGAGKLAKDLNEFDTWKLPKGSNEFSAEKLAKYQNEVDDGNLAKGHNEFNAWKLAKYPNETHDEKLAKYPNEFRAWKLAKDPIKIGAGKSAKDFKEIEAAQSDGMAKEEVDMYSGEADSKKNNAITCHGLDNFLQENGKVQPEMNGEYPDGEYPNTKFDFSKNAGKWSEVQ